MSDLLAGAPPTVHVYAPRGYEYRGFFRCPECDQKRRCVGQLFAWHSESVTCVACGDRFTAEEGRMERPPSRGWRKRGTAKARKAWDRIGSRSRRDAFGSLIADARREAA